MIRFFIFSIALSVFALNQARAQTLYNGVQLPSAWPPQMAELPDTLPTPDYLESPPDVIPIDVGRQLFVDDFLIEQTDMTRSHHRPTLYPGNPVIEPDKEWEMWREPMAIPFSVFHDSADQQFKMWYLAGLDKHLCLAVSDDGIRWTKPVLADGTNIVGPPLTRNLVIDPGAEDPQRRYKLLELQGGAKGTLAYRYSADGIVWSEPQWSSGEVFDATTWFYNPFRDKWVISIRHSSPTIDRGRIRRYWEFDDVEGGSDANWGNDVEDAPLWVGADRPEDFARPELAAPVQLYRLNCEAYESLMLGTFTIYRGNFAHASGDGRAFDTDRPKCNEICIGYTRDGFHWYRPDHRAWIGISDNRGDWNWGNMWSCGPGVVVVGDYLYIYAAGRAGKSMAGSNNDDAGGSGGLAFLRRDGFASMDARPVAGKSDFELTTRTLRFQGSHLFVNAATDGLDVEVLDSRGNVIEPYTIANCNSLKANDTVQAVTWKDAPDLAKVAGQEVKFRFTMSSGRLYSFWVSGDSSGASGGYVTAGGPGISGFKDTLGKVSYGRNRAPLADASDDRSIRDEDSDGRVDVELRALGNDPDGQIVQYEWLLRSKQVAVGANPVVQLPVGTHTVTLIVTDNEGAKGYDSIDIEVLPKNNLPPRKNMVMWVKADDIRGLEDGAAVATWLDATGNRYDPAQEEAARQPIWKATAAGGQPAVRFDGVDDYLGTQYVRGLMLTFGNATVFTVFKPDELRECHIFGQDFNTLMLSTEQGGSLAYTGGTGSEVRKLSTLRDGAIEPGKWHLASLVREGTGPGESRLFINGRGDDNGVPLHYHAVNSAAGHIGCGRGERGMFKGDIAEIILYAGALSDADRVAVEDYLSKKYGLPSDR